MSTGYANLATKTLAGDFRPTFALDLAHKDLRLALELADDLGVPGLIAPQVMSLMRMARGMGLGSSDSCAMVQVYETALDEKVRAP
jgi:3-hydroxyisobutyrate dehydrogenase-like beta-hydroxyacid dehydrogenase